MIGRKVLIAAVLAWIACAPAAAADGRKLIEVKKIDAPAKLKAGEGALRLSVRTQIQSTETLFVYFIEVLPGGGDGTRVLRFERGAGVPIMGSNMIDPKPHVYRVPEGRYRPVAFALKCNGLPFAGAVCSSTIGGMWPTGYYARSEPFLVVEAGRFTDGGDIIVEYDGPVRDPRGNINQVKKSPLDYALRWRPLGGGPPAAFAEMPATSPLEVPARFRSRITCERRPAGVMLYIPFAC